MTCAHMYVCVVSSLTDSPVGRAGITGVILFFTHRVFTAGPPSTVGLLLTNVLLLSSLIRI